MTETSANERTREQIIAKYRANYPILAAYRDICIEHNRSGGINEPMQGSGVNTEQGALMALERIGRPARDREDVLHAEAWIAKLTEEMESQYPPVDKTIADHVIDSMYPFSGCLPTDEEWLTQSEEDRGGDIDEVVARIRFSEPADRLYALLREAIEFGMPAILRDITRRYGEGRSAEPRFTPEVLRMLAEGGDL
jgi:hypothetical protein